MAQIWMDDENVGAQVIPRSNRKVMLNDVTSAKKSVLGKLDNVLYNNNSNKPNITPFKGANQMWPINCAPKLSLCKETLQKQHRKQIHKDAVHLNEGQLKGVIKSPLETTAKNDLYAKSADPKDNFDLFDFMDFPSKKCFNNCHKANSQGWQTPLLSADLIEKLLNHSIDLDEEIAHNNSSVIAFEDLDSFDSDLEPLKNSSYAVGTSDLTPDILDDSSLPLPIEFDADFDLF